jgi:hypothetical protein
VRLPLFLFAVLLISAVAHADDLRLIKGKILSVDEAPVCTSPADMESLWRAEERGLKAFQALGAKLGQEHRCSVLKNAHVRVLAQVKTVIPGKPPKAIFEIDTRLGKMYMLLDAYYLDPRST